MVCTSIEKGMGLLPMLGDRRLSATTMGFVKLGKAVLHVLGIATSIANYKLTVFPLALMIHKNKHVSSVREKVVAGSWREGMTDR